MKVGVLDTTALAIALCLVAPAKAELLQQVEVPSVSVKHPTVNSDGTPPIALLRNGMPSWPVQGIQYGVIEGSLGYPGEFIPPLRVCAENLDTQTQHCTQVQIKGDKYKYGVGYKIEVPPGRYQVFASDKERDAYFSQAVQCGLTIGCDTHKPIAVTVKPAQSVVGIDPVDWYGSTAEEAAKSTNYLVRH